MKMRPVRAESFHEDGRSVRRTDMTKLIVAFRSFANEPKKRNREAGVKAERRNRIKYWKSGDKAAIYCI